MRPHRVTQRHAEDLLVLALLVRHAEQPDRTHDDVAAGERGLADEHEGVERIAVAAERALDEAVVGRVLHRREEHAVEEDLAGLVVHLVLVARALRDLHDDGQHLASPVHRGQSSQARRYHPAGHGRARPPSRARRREIGVGPALANARERRGSPSTRPPATRGSGSTSSARSRTRTSRRCPATSTSGRRSAPTRSTSGSGPDKVIAATTRGTPTTPSPAPAREDGTARAGVAASRIRDNQRFLLVARRHVVAGDRRGCSASAVPARRSAPAPATIPTRRTPSRPLDRDDRRGARGHRRRPGDGDGRRRASTTRWRAGETRVVHGAERAGGLGRRRRRGAVTVDGQDLGRAGRSRGEPVDADASARVERSPRVRAEIVAVGTELLLGQIANTNARWMSEQLADDRRRRAASPGRRRQRRPRRRGAAVAASRADVVLVTGGLGPTQDDLTRDAIARRCRASPLVRHPELEAMLREKFAGFAGGRCPRTTCNRPTCPEGPGPSCPSAVRRPGSSSISPSGVRLYAMPGVPVEMVEMMDGTVLPELAARTGAAIVSRVAARDRHGGVGGRGGARGPVRRLDEPDRRVPGDRRRGEGAADREGGHRGGGRGDARPAGGRGRGAARATSCSPRTTRRLEETVLGCSVRRG